LICYEIIFPGQVIDHSDRPEWILNITNDGWYGISTGPYQHFVIARLRAVENGLPLIRVANTGISGVVDPYGRVVQILPLGEAGIIDTSLPKALIAPPWYAKY
jgi:apolipoprotein N-acyltransferase